MSARPPTWSAPGSKLWHGDALELIPEVGPVDAVITDPPYSSGARSDASRQWKNPATAMQIKDVDWFSHDQMTTWGFGWFARSAFSQIRRILRPGCLRSGAPSPFTSSYSSRP